jgi:outer membrane receptor for ferrienterochelin and colicins
MAKQSIYKVNTISSLEITQRAAISLNDVLNYEMNHFISNDNVLGTSMNIGGIGGQNVKVLVNGIPIMGRENGNIDMGQLNMNNIKRVEMIQGPMSVIYGSNALGGVVNLITATPKKKFALGARSYYESIGRYNFSGNMSMNKKNHQLQLSLARNFFAGWTPKDSIDRFQLWKPKTQYTGDLQYWFTIKKMKLSYFGSYLNEKITNKGQPIINPYEGYAFDEYYRTNRIINAVSANLPLNKTDQLAFTNSYQLYKRTKNRLKKDLVSLNEFETENVGDQDTTRFYDLNLRGTYTSSRMKHLDIVLGYEYAQQTGASYKLVDQKQRMSDIGIFGSASYTYKFFQLQPSLRVTYNNWYKTNFTPALHTKLDLNASTQLRASYARGFRAPTLKEMYLQFIDQNHTIIGNPDLKPEIGDHFEIGLEHQYAIKHAAASYSVNAYYNSIQNLIALAVFNNHGVLRQYENIETYKNLMLNIKGKITGSQYSLGAGTGVIYVEKTNVTPENTILECTFTGSYTWKKINTTFNLNYKYNSRQPVITVDQQFLYTSPMHIANVSAQHSFFKNALVAQVGVKNLFNLQNSTLTGSINPQSSGHLSAGAMQAFPARSFFIDVTYSF